MTSKIASKKHVVAISLLCALTLFALCCALVLTALRADVALAKDANAQVITEQNALQQAINNAKDGDVILVGDVNFAPLSPDEYLSTRKKTITKSITIKSANGVATFSNGMFSVEGSKVTGEVIDVKFENILFDGTIDIAQVNAENYPYDINFLEHALSFVGNVNCTLSNCTFTNYYHFNGAVINVKYADDTASGEASHTDQSACRLNLTFDSCKMDNNFAFYGGGAMQIAGNNNVTVNFNNCELTNNKSSCYNGLGGGFIYASGATINMTNCTLARNQGNYCFDGMEGWLTDQSQDNSRGGALNLNNCALNMTDCLVQDNVATVGGAFSLTKTMAQLDGCTIVANRAERCKAFVDGEKLLWPCGVGIAGAILMDPSGNCTVSLINSYVCNNSAEVAYGGVFQFYDSGIADPGDANYLNLTCCTYFGNDVDATYDYAQGLPLYSGIPGNVWADPAVTTNGCIVVDDVFGTSAFEKNQKPNSQNGYNYFGSLSQANSDGIEVTYKNQTLSVNLHRDAQWKIPKDALKQMLGDRYDGKLSNAVVGSNYRKSLYQQPNPTGKIVLFSLLGVALIAVVATIVIIVVKANRKKCCYSTCLVVDDAFDDDKPQQQVIIAKYSCDEVERILQRIPQVELLTNREKEVLREMLLGKRQGEIAKQLFISVSTVKDFYKKIYDKLGVENKTALTQMIVDVASAL